MNTSLKTCFKCKEEKPVEGFYRHSRMADGRVNKCKECNKKDVRENRYKRADYYREYDRKRGSRQDKAYRDSYRERFPEKYKAHYLLTNAVRDGRVKRQSCEKCGREDTHGHHHDYSKPLEVRWLCPPCHAEEHPKF